MCTACRKDRHYVRVATTDLQVVHESVYKSVSKRLFNLHKKEKGKALRKKVMEKSKKSVKKLDINFILNDDSENKNASHYRLKSELAVNKELADLWLQL
jgi:hypothetical protein